MMSKGEHIIKMLPVMFQRLLIKYTMPEFFDENYTSLFEFLQDGVFYTENFDVAMAFWDEINMIILGIKLSTHEIFWDETILVYIKNTYIVGHASDDTEQMYSPRG